MQAIQNISTTLFNLQYPVAVRTQPSIVKSEQVEEEEGSCSPPGLAAVAGQMGSDRPGKVRVAGEQVE